MLGRVNPICMHAADAASILVVIFRRLGSCVLVVTRNHCTLHNGGDGAVVAIINTSRAAGGWTIVLEEVPSEGS